MCRIFLGICNPDTLVDLQSDMIVSYSQKGVGEVTGRIDTDTEDLAGRS